MTKLLSHYYYMIILLFVRHETSHSSFWYLENEFIYQSCYSLYHYKSVHLHATTSTPFIVLQAISFSKDLPLISFIKTIWIMLRTHSLTHIFQYTLFYSLTSCWQYSNLILLKILEKMIGWPKRYLLQVTSLKPYFLSMSLFQT